MTFWYNVQITHLYVYTHTIIHIEHRGNQKLCDEFNFTFVYTLKTDNLAMPTQTHTQTQILNVQFDSHFGVHVLDWMYEYNHKFIEEKNDFKSLNFYIKLKSSFFLH